MQTQTRDKGWNDLTLEEKVEDLREDVATLFDIAENASHQQHMFMEAIGIVHSKLDDITALAQRVQRKINRSEWAG